MEIKTSLTDNELIDAFWKANEKKKDDLASDLRFVADVAAKRAIEDFLKTGGKYPSEASIRRIASQVYDVLHKGKLDASR